MKSPRGFNSTLPRRTKPMRRSPITWRPTKPQVRAKRRRKLKLLKRSGGACEGCGGRGRRLDEAHLIPLGMGRSRWDQRDPLNALSNVAGLCAPCHAWLDSQPHDWRRALQLRLEAAGPEVLRVIGELRTSGVLRVDLDLVEVS